MALELCTDADDEALRQELSGSGPESDVDTNPESVPNASSERQTEDAEGLPQSAPESIGSNGESHADLSLAASSDDLGSDSSSTSDSDSNEVCFLRGLSNPDLEVVAAC